MPSLTKSLIDAAKPGEKDRFIWDDLVRGLGVKVTPAGRKVFVLQYRMTGGRGSPTRRYTLGGFGSPWTVETARKEARRLLGRIAENVDPMGERQRDRSDQRRARAHLFGEAVTRYCRERREEGLRSIDEVERILRREAVARWENKPISAITADDVDDLLQDTKRRAPILANRLHAHLRALFKWCAARPREWVQRSPLPEERPLRDEPSRARVVTATELRDIWAALDKIGNPFAGFVRALFLLAQRRNEVAGMRWDEIDWQRRKWTIPGSRAKNGLVHDVPLSTQAIELLSSMPRLKDEDGNATFVFSTTGAVAFSGFSKAKALLDEKIRELRVERAVTEGRDATKVQPIPRWTLHDARRTAVTLMAENDIAPHVADKAINHTTGAIKGVTKVYLRYEYWPERVIALDVLGREIERIVTGSGDSDNVVPMVRA